MELAITDAVTTRLHSKGSETEAPESEILLNGVSTGKLVSGAVLEAALTWGECYLLFMTDDIPYEDMLGIHLFDRQFNLVDSATLGGIYATGSFSSLELTQPNWVSFRFIGGITWRVELLPKPVFRLPFLSDPKGVSRRFGLWKHFRVIGKPVPEASG